MTTLVTVKCHRCGHEWRTVKFQYAFCRKCGCIVKVPR